MEMLEILGRQIILIKSGQKSGNREEGKGNGIFMKVKEKNRMSMTVITRDTHVMPKCRNSKKVKTTTTKNRGNNHHRRDIKKREQKRSKKNRKHYQAKIVTMKSVSTGGYVNRIVGNMIRHKLGMDGGPLGLSI